MDCLAAFFIGVFVGETAKNSHFYKNLMDEEHINIKSVTLTNKVYKIHA